MLVLSLVHLLVVILLRVNEFLQHQVADANTKPRFIFYLYNFFFLFVIIKASNPSKWLRIIIINIRGQKENRPLGNSCCAGRKWLPGGCKCIYGPAADWFLDHHPMEFNQSGTLLTRENHLCFEVNAVRR